MAKLTINVLKFIRMNSKFNHNILSSTMWKAQWYVLRMWEEVSTTVPLHYERKREKKAHIKK